MVTLMEDRCSFCWSPAVCSPSAVNDKHLRVECPKCGLYRLAEQANQSLGEWVFQMEDAGVHPPLPPNHRALSAMIRAEYERNGHEEVFIDDYDALRSKARAFGAGVWPGQVWSDNPERSAVIRTFSILSLHQERNAAVHTESGSERYAYCHPNTAAVSGSHDNSGLDRFFAELDAFPPFGDRYSLTSYDPAWPGQSQTPILTPAGTLRKERDGRYLWTDKEGQTHEAAEYTAESVGELSRHVHKLVYGTAGPQK
jgi:hypothetical protein